MKQFFKIDKNYLWLLIIFLLAFGLRVFQIGQHPTFISDEASIGYNAYSILKTGRDEWGQFLPLAFKSFGEYKLPAYIYLVVPSIAIFGLNEFAVRFPSALFGSLTVVLVYWLVKEIFSKTGKFSIFNFQFSIGGLAALLLAISPWHIQASRMALEANVGLFIILAAILLLLKAKTNNKLYYVSFSLFVLSFYTYNSCRVFAPLLLFIYLFFNRREIRFFSLVKPMLLAMVLLLPLFLSGFAGSPERIYKVGLFNDPGLTLQINENRGKCFISKPQMLCTFRYNKPVVYTSTFIKNYFSHFSWRFLFGYGSGLAQYSVPYQGMFYFWEMPFILIGLVFILKANKNFFLFLISWLAIAPIANSLTGLAHPVRSILMLPVFQILTGTGMTISVIFFKKRIYFRYIYSFLLVLVVIFSLAGFAVKYFIYYPQVADWNWQMGYRPLYQKLAQIEQEYNKIYISKFYGEPHIFFLFHTRYDPKQYQEGKEVVRYDREDKWVNVDRIGKYYFVQEPQKIIPSKGELLVVPIQEFAFQGKIIDIIEYKNGGIAFLLETHG